MRKTTNYGLALYDKEDKMNITSEENSLNHNMELIDSALKEKATETFVTNKIAEAQLEGSDVDLSGYATKEDLHTHDNKSILDSITQEDIDRWNSGGGTGGSCLLTEQTITIGETGDVPVTGIELDYSTMSINVGESFQLAATVLPANASNNVVTWKSSDSSIATCVEGYVTGIKGGKVNITAVSMENSSITVTCVVNVIEASSDGKIYFKDLMPVNTKKMLKKDGVTEYDNNDTQYYQLPYSEGMQISTYHNQSFEGNYPPFIIKDGSSVTSTIGTKTLVAGALHQYETTLTGYSSEAIVYVNARIDTTKDDIKYYIEGGN